MRVFPIVVAVPLALALAGTAVAADLALGKKVFESKCASCPGADGKGNAKMAGMLKVTIPDLRGAAGMTDAELTKLVSEGRKPMPSFAKRLSEEEMSAVISYAKSLAKGTGGK